MKWFPISAILQSKGLGWKLTSTLLLCLFGLCLALALTFLIILPTSGEQTLDLSNPATLKWVQLIQSILTFVLPALLLRVLFWGSESPYRQTIGSQWKGILLACFAIIVASPMINALAAWNESIHLPHSLASLEQWMREQEDAAALATNLLLTANSWVDLLINILIVGVLAGVGEELLFRGTLQKAMTSHQINPHVAIWSIAILFSAIHLQFYGFIPRMLLGAWFGYLYWWSGSIMIAIAAHSLNNIGSVLTLYAIDQDYIAPQWECIGTGDTLYMAIISTIMVIGLTLVFYRVSAGNLEVDKEPQ